MIIFPIASDLIQAFSALACSLGLNTEGFDELAVILKGGYVFLFRVVHNFRRNTFELGLLIFKLIEKGMP